MQSTYSVLIFSRPHRGNESSARTKEFHQMLQEPRGSLVCSIHGDSWGAISCINAATRCGMTLENLRILQNQRNL